MIASLDGIDLDGKFIVEIKCPGPTDHEIAMGGKIPEKYYPQLQHQLAVTEVEMMYYTHLNSRIGFLPASASSIFSAFCIGHIAFGYGLLQRQKI